MEKEPILDGSLFSHHPPNRGDLEMQFIYFLGSHAYESGKNSHLEIGRWMTHLYIVFPYPAYLIMFRLELSGSVLLQTLIAHKLWPQVFSVFLFVFLMLDSFYDMGDRSGPWS